MASKKGVLRQIRELETLSRSELQKRWEELFPTPPPKCYRRDALLKRLIYRTQELAFGGVSEATRSKLRDHLKLNGLDSIKSQKAYRRQKSRREEMPVAGTILRREWRGDTYEVTVHSDGFEFQGKPYKSLSAIAKAITKSHWNGWAFFGLKKRKKKSK